MKQTPIVRPVVSSLIQPLYHKAGGVYGRVDAAVVPVGGIASIQIVDSTPIDVQSGIGVDGSGWVAVVCLKGITSTAGSLDASKLTLTVMDAGYLADGSETTVTRTIKGVAYMRRPFPNGNLRMISTDGMDLYLHITLDDWVYGATSIVGAQIEAGFYTDSVAGNAPVRTNNSVIAYPKPIFAWINPQNERTGTSHAVECVAFHRYARNQQQVACIKFQASDGTNQSAEVTTGTSELSSRVIRGNIPEVWKATLDMSGLAQATTCNINAKVYPWLGNASAVLDLAVDGPAWPTAYPNTRLRVFCDRTGGYGGAFAYVKAGASAGTVSATAATAKADPYPTVTAAMNAVRTWNGANRGHTDHGGATIRLMDDGSGGAQTHTISGAPTTSTPATHYIIEKDPDTAATISISFTTQSVFPSMVYWRNLSHTPNITYSWIGPNTAESQFVVDNCVIANPSNLSIVAWYDFKYVLNILQTSGTNGTDLWNRFPLASSAVSVVAGFESTTAEGPALWAIAVIGMDAPTSITGSVVGAYQNNNRVIYNNKMRAMVLQYTGTATTNLYGAAVVQNRCEHPNSGGVTLLNLFADGDLTTMGNLVDFCNTGVGERCSRMYNDAAGSKVAPSGTVKRGVSRYNVWDNFNTKGDYFVAGNGQGSVGAWSYQYNVGNVGNVSLFGRVDRTAAQLPSNGAVDGYLGMAWLPSSEPNLFRTALGFTQAQIMDMFENYTAAPRAVPAVGGDYRPKSTATYLKNRVPAGQAVLRYDLSGVSRKNDGSGAAGAYEASA